MTLPANAEVPTFDIKLWHGRQHDYAVVIPVINEGARIQSLLQRFTDLNLRDVIDIIIVDGGSTDGSLEPDFLKQHHVRGLLLKTGQGKLSAQLRCAYAFALEQNYQGIITIDGNNKDNPALIHNFIAVLKNGVDFVQASRFVPGGVAVNTPLLRHVAIRLLHAPLLSFFSGFHWTDSTQGFRAYSRRLLLSPDLAIFRNVFSGYELLAYISYRAPRLGFNCMEMASERRYPQNELPTKINGLKGYWSVFAVLLRACMGHYNPK